MKTYEELNTFADWEEKDKDQFSINVIKGLIMDGVRNANSGHTGGALSSIDFAYLLFTEYLKYDPDDPDWVARDRFVLSAGHESMLLYSLLHMVGWLKLDDLRQFRQLNSNTPGHPEVEIPGVEATTGPLGQGVGMATGMALAEVIVRHLFGGNDLLSHFTYVLAGDGDLQEPVALGAAALAGHWGLSKLIMYYDSNGVQISGNTSRSDSTDVALVFKGLGWHVQEVNGHDLSALRKAVETARQTEQPSIIVGKTIMAHGTVTMEGDAGTHGSPLSPDEISKTKEKLGIAPEAFVVPPEVYGHFRRRFEALRAGSKEWKKELETARSKPEFRRLWEQVVEDKLPQLEYPEFEAGTSVATRKAFGVVLEHFAGQLPHLVGGSADLEPSNYTGGFAEQFGDYQKDNRNGRNLAFGVREFPMAAIMNGLALHGGIIPFGGTFLVFADYSRPALRLGALQKIRVIHEFTHDSFFVGEDGPTHQPVEQIMALRTIPDFNVYRPADAKETAVCFKLAIEDRETPSAILLSRQGLPVISEDIETIEKGVRRGGYVIRDCEGSPEIVLLATGSEVSLALEVAERIADRRVRVVSLPCWEIFDRQPEEYRNNLIPPRGCLKVSLEAGITLGWERYVGPTGLMIGLDRFGASAPAGELARVFGFTPDQVESKIREKLSALL
ncbi:MAG: transketolase [FCB group bacterium]|nr:transketolase [FCB group bacterium]